MQDLTPYSYCGRTKLIKALVSHLKDSTLKEAPKALLRAGEKARQLAKQTGTKFIVRRATSSALNKQK